MDQNHTVVLTAIKTAVKSTVTVKSIEQGVNRYLEGSQTFLKALDEIGKIHPFVQGLSLDIGPKPDVFL